MMKDTKKFEKHGSQTASIRAVQVPWKLKLLYLKIRLQTIVLKNKFRCAVYNTLSASLLPTSVSPKTSKQTYIS